MKVNLSAVPVYTHRALVIGSGAAGLNAADLLHRRGVETAVLTEGWKMGTSRNTGSDKQTYYKLTTAGDTPDSVRAMAQTYADGGSMHGDLALNEAASSLRAFYRLVELGVPFPYNEVGEYVGYRTDHDARVRATSCGPLTSKYMTEALSDAVLRDGLTVYDGYRMIRILTHRGRACGVLALSRHCVTPDNPAGLCIVYCRHLVMATGGPSAIYRATVYPQSQFCSHGAAFLAGAEGVNLTESQYGVASVKFRWNLSGSYQQVIPRYVSVGEDGVPREFLRPSFRDDGDLFDSVFLKGYQWPFDPRKASGSSRVDLAVYREKEAGRRVFLDFTRDADGFSFDRLGGEAREYLQNSGADGATPIERLAKLNPRAIALYASHGIDLRKELLEIDVCAQHNNGGLAVDTNYESTTLKGLYPVGECAGVFGVYRPGGSALNSTQVTSLRAAQWIARQEKTPEPVETPDDPLSCASGLLSCLEPDGEKRGDVDAVMSEHRARMSSCGAFIREEKAVGEAENAAAETLARLPETFRVNSFAGLYKLALLEDVLRTQTVYLAAILDYIRAGGKSRGSYLINGDPEPDTENTGKLRTIRLTDGGVVCRTEDARPIPQSEQWFEKVYNAFEA